LFVGLVGSNKLGLPPLFLLLFENDDVEDEGLLWLYGLNSGTLTFKGVFIFEIGGSFIDSLLFLALLLLLLLLLFWKLIYYLNIIKLVLLFLKIN